MLKNLIVLPDGTEIYSGAHEGCAIQKCKHKELVNSGAELTPGSVCAAVLEITLFSPQGELSIGAGDEIEYYKVDDEDNSREKIGVFICEKPVCKSVNIYTVTAYDRVILLDKDLSVAFRDMEEAFGEKIFPLKIGELPFWICGFCRGNTDMDIVSTDFPNADFPAAQPDLSKPVTGRQMMGWIAELAGGFCRATPDGNLEIVGYSQTQKTVRPTGNWYYFQSSLQYEDYEVAPIEAVRIRLADSESGAYYPVLDSSVNAYSINGNQFIKTVTADIIPYLNVLQEQIGSRTYRPCRFSMPANTFFRAGDIIRVIDANGFSFSTLIMSKTQNGSRDTIECTGSPRRDSPTAANSFTPGDYRNYADNAAGSAFRNLTQLQVFNKLTNYGKAQGFFIDEETGEVYVNATYIKSGQLLADLITAGILQSQDGGESFRLNMETGEFHMVGSGRFQSSDGKAYITVDGKEIVLYAWQENKETYIGKIRIGFVSDISGVDYPYILLGDAGDNASAGLIKKFYDGIWVGNSAPMNDTGKFVAKTGYHGTFVHMSSGEVLAVRNGETKALFDGDTTARFG